MEGQVSWVFAGGKMVETHVPEELGATSAGYLSSRYPDPDL